MMKFLIVLILCASVSDCLEKADKAFSVQGSNVYVSAANVYATQNLAKALAEREKERTS